MDIKSVPHDSGFMLEFDGYRGGSWETRGKPIKLTLHFTGHWWLKHIAKAIFRIVNIEISSKRNLKEIMIGYVDYKGGK